VKGEKNYIHCEGMMIYRCNLENIMYNVLKVLQLRYRMWLFAADFYRDYKFSFCFFCGEVSIFFPHFILSVMELNPDQLKVLDLHSAYEAELGPF
jgi:hypothetical protein